MSARRPNILLMQVDQLAARWLPIHGQQVVRAPHIQALADSGVVFDSAYCNSPLCSPSRFSMMAGALPSRIGAYDNAADFPADMPTVAHYLRAAGYRTTLSGKMHFCGPDQLHGFEERLTTDIYPSDYGWTPDWERPEVRPSWYHNMSSVLEAGTCARSNQLDYDEEVVYAARRHLFDVARSGDARPFFLAVSLTHPHDPYAMLPEWFDRYRDADIPLPSVRAADVANDPHSTRLRHVSDMNSVTLTDAQVARARRAYFASISYVDAQLGVLRHTLAATGLDADTIIVFTADHGDMLGERGLWFKMSWFDPSAHVPLIVHAPAMFGAKRVAASVSLMDLLPTFAEIAGEGRTPDYAAPIDGRSLLPHLDGSDGHDEVFGEYLAEGALAPIFMIRRGSWKFVTAAGDPDQLYDLTSDPEEQINLVGWPAHDATLAALQTEAAARWNSDILRNEVVASQRRRRLVDAAHRIGRYTPWDYEPVRDASRSYMRNSLELDDLEKNSRLPARS